MTLCDQLKDIIEEYFDRYPNMSINALAGRSKVGASTLRRILNGTIKGEPSPHTVLNIASATSKEKSLARLLNIFDGEVGGMLNEAFGPFVEVDAPHVYANDLNKELGDSMSYVVYKLAANKRGVEKEEVKELFGKMGLESAEKLLDKGLVQESEGVYHARDKDFSLDVRIAANHLPELVKFYKPERVNEGKNLFYTLSESLNEEGIQKIKDLQREAAKKIFDIMQSPLYEGEHPYFTVQVCDTLTLRGEGEVVQ